jgi:hypothetical protein
MRWKAAALLMAIGIGGGAFVANKALHLVIDVTFEHESSASDLDPNLISGWHFRVPLCRKPCFGLCPELERIP